MCVLFLSVFLPVCVWWGGENIYKRLSLNLVKWSFFVLYLAYYKMFAGLSHFKFPS
jgi:hypothetical protein